MVRWSDKRQLLGSNFEFDFWTSLSKSKIALENVGLRPVIKDTYLAYYDHVELLPNSFFKNDSFSFSNQATVLFVFDKQKVNSNTALLNSMDNQNYIKINFDGEYYSISQLAQPSDSGNSFGSAITFSSSGKFKSRATTDYVVFAVRLDGNTLYVHENENQLARGLVSFNSKEIDKIKGRQSNEMEKILGYLSKSEIIHKDNMVKL